MLFWVNLLLFCLFGSFAAGAEGLEIQLPDLGRHGFRHDRLPVDLRTAETIAHGAEEHHVHTLGIAKLDGDVAGGNGDGLECPGHGLDAALGIFLLTGGDGDGVDGIVSLPMFGKKASINVGNAAAAVLYAILAKSGRTVRSTPETLDSSTRLPNAEGEKEP